MDESKLRAWWSHLQGLDGRLIDRPAPAILEETGWARSVGGASPYLTLFARGGIGRHDVDAAVASVAMYELPAARNCTYVVPASDFALALRVGQNFADNDMKVARKLGVTHKEVDKLGDAVMKALAKGPLDPEALRQAVGGAIRNLGEEGKKKGVTTTLPLALGKLQAFGHIRRIPINGRLDQQRYRYTAWEPNPLAELSLSMDEAFTELARRYFSWIGPATLREFQAFSGLGVKASQAAVEPLGLEALGDGDDRLMLPGDCEKLDAFEQPTEPHFVLVSALDGMMLLRRDVRGLLRAEHRENLVGGKEISGLTDLPSHAILDRGSIVGLWEFDPESAAIIAVSFIGNDAELAKAIRHTQEFVKRDLDDARLFSLDSPKSRRPRLDALRGARGALMGS